ncbi:Set1 complex component ash2 [Ceratocystis lukuohia]|uniref:Set1 complex component ash2 n=1 Tax=Ceratocystis lukuohia TaxID=2019550 RepID=A0ABR4MN17_9PEZI
MPSERGTPSRETTPSAIAALANHSVTSTLATPTTTLLMGQKRTLDDVHAPSIPSPLNPESSNSSKVRATADEATGKPVRVKKEPVGRKRDATKTGSLDPAMASRPTSDVAPLRYKLAPPKTGDFLEAKVAAMVLKHEIKSLDGSVIEFCEATDHVFNKRGYHYTRCIADPLFPSSNYYHHTEAPPYGPHMSIEDSAMHVYFDRSCRHVTTDKGFRMAKANVAIREGRWYWEVRITKGIPRRAKKDKEREKDKNKDVGGPHVRVGFARREASLDAPVGFDAYSYGIRDKEGHKVHMSRPKPFLAPGEDIEEGDVLGLEIYLPTENLQRKVLAGQYNPAVDSDQAPASNSPESAEAPNIVRDRIPIRFKSHLYFEQIDYHSTRELEDLMNPAPTGSIKAGTPGTTPMSSTVEKPNPNHPQAALRTLPGSYIKVYKNGKPMGTAFDNLLCFLPPASKPMQQAGVREGLDDGTLGYYPAVSVFRMGAAETNFGPNFWFPPEDYVEPQASTSVWKTRAGKLKILRPLSERLTEQIIEDTVYDLVDEVDFWLQDGGGPRGASSSKIEVGAEEGAVDNEIKELVQDD